MKKTTSTNEKRPLVPTIRSLYLLIRELKAEEITEESRACEEDEEPGIQLTIGCNMSTGAWDYQTGDNSVAGGAYFYPDWAVIHIYRHSNCRVLAKDAREQLLEQFYTHYYSLDDYSL